MIDVTEEELQELERKIITHPGCLDPTALERLIAALRYWRGEAAEESQLANSMELLCTAMITERDAYRDKLARVVADIRRPKRRRR